MRANLRFLLPFLGAFVALSTTFAFYQASEEKRGLQRALDRRAATMAEGLVGAVEPALAQESFADLSRIAQRVSRDDRTLGMAVYNASGMTVASTPRLQQLPDKLDAFALAQEHRQGVSKVVRAGDASLHVFALPLYLNERLLGVLALIHDGGEIDEQGARVARAMLLHGLLQALLIGVSLLFVMRSKVSDQIEHAAAWIRSVHAGQRGPSALSPDGVFQPLTREVTDLVRSLDAARAAAEQEARLRDASESRWTAERLRVSVQGKLQNSRLFVVANREPYMHVLNESGVSVLVPASGLVTAIEPVLLACEGRSPCGSVRRSLRWAPSQ